MTERVLTERELRSTLLARQLLLERASMPIPRALERIGGIQDQYAPSGYIGLWSRLAGFERAALTRALERRTVVQGTLMRATIHLVARRDYWPLVIGIRGARRAMWRKAIRHALTERQIAAIAARVRKALQDGPRRRADVVAELGLDSAGWNGAGLWVDLVRVPPSGTWEQRKADLYGLADAWVGPEPALDPPEGLEVLVRRYLSGFGPAARKDVASFVGTAIGELASVLDAMTLRRFRGEDGTELLDLPRATIVDGDLEPPVRFLPTWDATLLVHARRTQILPERFRPLVFNTKTPHSVSTFLVDGQVAGTWREGRGRVTVAPFEPLPRTAKREVDAEAERVAAFMA